MTQIQEPLVQTFYVPYAENQLLTMFQDLWAEPGVSPEPESPITSSISFSPAADDTIIVVDHYEDGYEDDIDNPLQSSTQVWGDGDLTNGIAPGTANDIIEAGKSFVVTESVVTTQSAITEKVSDLSDGSPYQYNGQDKISVSKTVSMSRVSFATGSGGLMTQSTLVYDIDNWGIDYIVPIGTDTTDSYAMFEYTAVTIVAGEDGAEVKIDLNNDGDFEDTDEVQNILEGESYLSPSNLKEGTKIESDNPIMVNILTGDINPSNSGYESRDTQILPTNLWSYDYYSPVSTVGDNVSTRGSANSTRVFLYNPNPTTITINYQKRNGTGSIQTGTIDNIASGENGSIELLEEDAIRFYTNDPLETFFAFSVTDADETGTGANNSANFSYDWGYPLIPVNSLTSQYQVGFGRGTDEVNPDPQKNSTPVWVTPVGNGETAITVYVDFNGDNEINNVTTPNYPTYTGGTDPNGGKYDASFSLKELQQKFIYDPDGDQTGMLVYVLNIIDTDGDGIDDDDIITDYQVAGAWGQHTTNGIGGTTEAAGNSLDAGNGIPPLPAFDAGKNAFLLTDNDGDGFISAGDVIRYSIIVNNISRAPVPDVLVTDTVPIETLYQTGTTQYRIFDGTNWGAYIPIADEDIAGVDVPENDNALLPLTPENNGENFGNLLIKNRIEVTFDVIIDPFPDIDVNSTKIENIAFVKGKEVPDKSTVIFGSIGDKVWFDANGDGSQDAGEPGISNVTVFIDKNSNGTLDPGEKSVVTDGDGIYKFNGLGAGTYDVRVLTTSLPSGLVASYDLDAGNDSIASAAITPGQKREDVDFGYKNDPGKGTIKITKVADPADGTDFTFTATGTGLSNFTLDVDSDPTFSDTIIFSNLTAGGTYTITENDLTGTGWNFDNINVTESISTASQNITGQSITVTLDDLEVIDITFTNKTGSNDTIDAGLYQTGATLSGYVYYDINNDGIRDPNGVNDTLGDADDEIGLIQEMYINNIDTNEQFTTTTNSDGYYEFTGLDAGTYVVGESFPNNAIQAPKNYEISSGVFVDFLDGKETAGSGGGTVDNTSNVSFISEVTLAANTNYTDYNFGEILPGTITGKVLDVTGGSDGIRGVTITLNGTNDRGFEVGTKIVQTDPNGNFSFTNLRPGTSYYITETEPSGYQDATTPSDQDGTASGNGTFSQNIFGLSSDRFSGITVGIDQTIGDYIFQEVIPSSNNSSISGYVYSDNNPQNDIKDAGETGSDNGLTETYEIPGVTVRLYENLTGGGTQLIGSQVTDVNGFYEFSNLDAGNYYLQESQPSAYADGQESIGSTALTNATGVDTITNIDLAAGESKTDYNFGELALPTLGSIAGSVYVDANDNGLFDGSEQALPAVNVTLFKKNNLNIYVQEGNSKVTQSDGSYIFSNLQPGDYEVRQNTQPSSYNDGQDSINNVPIANSKTTDEITGLTITGSEALVNNNFGELEQTSGSGKTGISGFVYVDSNNDGVKDTGEGGIPYVYLLLYEGTTYAGYAVTDSTGYYEISTDTGFTLSTVVSYDLFEYQPGGYIDGIDTIGTGINGNGGNAGLVGTDQITGIQFNSEDFGINYNFGELLTSGGLP